MRFKNKLLEYLQKTSMNTPNGSICDDLDEILVTLKKLFLKQTKKIFFIGNGGSAAIACHMTADFAKNGDKYTVSMYDPAMLTCLGNDYGYEYVFSKQVERQIAEGDILVAISSSGNSENIIKAIQVAKEHGGRVVTFTGFDKENKCRVLGDFNLHVPCMEYGIVESIHNLILQEVVEEIHREIHK